MLLRRAARTATLIVALAAALPSAVAKAQAPMANVLRIPFPRYDGTLTPYTFKLGYPLVTLVYDTLLWRDAQGIPRPWLARSVTRSNGGRRVTVRLREGVRWQDGRRLTADDVVFTFQFVAEHSRVAPELDDVQRTQAIDPLTVRVDLRRPSLGFDHQPLADLPILPRHLWQGLPAGQLAPRGLPVGSGPYRLLRARRSTGYQFRANAKYFKGKPEVERIDVPIIRQEQRTYDALRDRRVDMLPFSLPKVAANDLRRSFGINLRTGPSYSGTAVLLNLRRPPFDRPAARRAVANALDLDRLVRNVGPAVAAHRGYVHPDSPWSYPRPLQRFDPSAARRKVAALRLPAIRVLAPANDPVRLEAGRQVVLALQRAGANATLGKATRGKLSQTIGENGASPNFDAAIVSTPPLASYDPDFLDRLFGSDPRSAPLNYSGYRSAAFDALAARVARAPDQRSRRPAVEAELRLLATDLPAIPLFFSQGTFAYRSAIYDGWVFIKGSGIFDKRSFLPGEAPARGGSGADQVAKPKDSGSSSLDAASVVSLAVLGVALLVALVAAAALLRRRLTGRR